MWLSLVKEKIPQWSLFYSSIQDIWDITARFNWNVSYLYNVHCISDICQWLAVVYQGHWCTCFRNQGMSGKKTQATSK